MTSTLTKYSPWMLGLFRIVTALVFMEHGTQKLLNFPPNPPGRPAVELFSHTETWRFGYAHLPGQSVLDTGGRHPTVHEAWSALSDLLAAPRAAR